MPGEAGILIAGRYVLSEPVGQGATGRVWRARDQLLDRDVAVKEVLIPPQSAQDSALTVARVAREAELAREAQAAAGLDHPDAVTFYDVAEQDGALWIVTRFVPGTSLSAEIGRLGRLPWQRAARIAGQVAEALARAHGAGLVHRDLKPGNILLTGPSADRAVVAGFGISPVLDFRTRLTDAEARVGGFAYLAPEQLTGFYDLPPADMWALGAALYTAVEGRPPFTGSTAIEVISAIYNQPGAMPEHAGLLRDLIDALLAKDPADRPDAQAAMTALAGIAAPHPDDPLPDAISPAEDAG